MTLTPTQIDANARAAAAIAAEEKSAGYPVGYAGDPAKEPYVTPVLTREDYMSEAEKNPRGDPVTIAEEPTHFAERLDIAPREPYPTGNPYQPSWAEINGFSGPLMGDTVIGQQATPRGEVNLSSLPA
jgi:hypothetical protein